MEFAQNSSSSCGSIYTTLQSPTVKYFLFPTNILITTSQGRENCNSSCFCNLFVFSNGALWRSLQTLELERCRENLPIIIFKHLCIMCGETLDRKQNYYDYDGFFIVHHCIISHHHLQQRIVVPSIIIDLMKCISKHSSIVLVQTSL